MSFETLDIVTSSARQRQQRLLERSARSRLVERADRRQPTAWRHKSDPGPPEAA